MEKWNVLGWKSVDFTDPQGRHVKGYSLFLERLPVSPDVIGMEVQKLFISSEYVAYEPVEGQTIGLIFNRYGKVQSIEVID